MDHRAATLVDHPEPAHLTIIFKLNMFFCIHLPGVMGRGGPFPVDPWPPPRRRRGQLGPREPASERAYRGDEALRVAFEQDRSDQLGTPGGMRAAEVDGRLHRLRMRDVGGRATVSRRDRCRTVAAEPLEQAIDRRARDAERLGDFRGRELLLPEPEDDLSDGDGERRRHGETSKEGTRDRSSHSELMSRTSQPSWPDFILKLHGR